MPPVVRPQRLVNGRNNFLNATQANCSRPLMPLASELIIDGCADRAPPPEEGTSLVDLALRAMPVSSFAPTPAFNLDDHFKLLAAVAHAARAVPEPSVHNLEVGSFAGHTLLLQAAALTELGLGHSMAHSVECCTHGLGVNGTGVGSMGATMDFARQGGLNATWHKSFVNEMPPWKRPLRLLFEDSLHKPAVTHDSFQHFEHRLVEGGVVVLHDVGCCAREYAANVEYLDRRVFQRANISRSERPYYRELFSSGPQPLTPHWDAFNESTRNTLRGALIRSFDKRQQWHRLFVTSMNRTAIDPDMIRDCEKVCNHRLFGYKVLAGYQFSACMNTRVFQRIPRSPPLMLRADGPNPMRRVHVKRPTMLWTLQDPCLVMSSSR